MMLELMLGMAVAAQPAGGPQPASLNPHATELFDRDPVLKSWAVQRFDRNRDGWLTLYEAQPALAELKSMADANGDGRVTVREFEEAKAFITARHGGETQVVAVR